MTYAHVMSDYDDEMDARGQDHDLTTGDPTTRQQLRTALHALADRLYLVEAADITYMQSDGGFIIIDQQGRDANEFDGFAQAWIDDDDNIAGYTSDPVSNEDVYETIEVTP